jgi:hypothetical protein
VDDPNQNGEQDAGVADGNAPRATNRCLQTVGRPRV